MKLFSRSVGATIAVTIESSLESGHGLSHESSQDGYNGTCVKLKASNSM